MERITRLMSEREYLDFYKARQTSFANRLQPSKFRDWLYNAPYNQLNAMQWPIKPNALAIEILQYLAYETVAILVDLALVVKQDQQRHSADPVSKLAASVNSASTAYPLLHSSKSSSTFSSPLSAPMSGSYTPPTPASSHTNLTNLLNPTAPFGDCSSLNTPFGMTPLGASGTPLASPHIAPLSASLGSFTPDHHNQQPTKTTILPSPFLFASANVPTQVSASFLTRFLFVIFCVINDYYSILTCTHFYWYTSHIFLNFFSFLFSGT